MKRYPVDSAPHRTCEDTTLGVMRDVCVAMLPAFLWGVYLFGLRALWIGILSLISFAVADGAAQALLRRRVTLSDGSALVSGMIFAMMLPVTAPLWVIPVGAVLAMLLGKQCFGGLGKNRINPAMAARTLILAGFFSRMTRFVAPGASLSVFSLSEGEVAGALAEAPFVTLGSGSLPSLSATDLLMGNHAGNLGEGSCLLLLAGFLYLLVRKVITWHVPVTFLGTVALLSLPFPLGGEGLEGILFSLCTDGLIFSAVFVATDPVTSPLTGKGKAVYGALCGVMTVVLRFLLDANLGIGLAILLSGATARYWDRLFWPLPFGVLPEKKTAAAPEPAPEETRNESAR